MTLKRFRIGERIRFPDGQVGTVIKANVFSNSKTMMVQMDDGKIRKYNIPHQDRIFESRLCAVKVKNEIYYEMVRKFGYTPQQIVDDFIERYVIPNLDTKE
jgi:hypothetical protein